MIRLIRHILVFISFLAMGACGSSVKTIATSGSSETADTIANQSISTLAPADSTINNISDSIKLVDSTLYQQNDSIAFADSTLYQNIDSINTEIDTSYTENIQPQQQLLAEPLKKQADSAIVFDVSNKKVYLYKNAQVTYLDKQIDADYMDFDSESNVIFATGVEDSVGAKKHVIFKDNSDSYEINELYHNFASEKTKIVGVVTQQGEAYMHAGELKKISEHVTCAKDGKYTTCNLKDCPHFYIQMSRSKVISGQKADKDGKGGKSGQMMFGFSYLVVEDVPLYPLFIPFGFIPLMSDNSSGLIIPSYGEERERGLYLQGFGYYFLLGDYADVRITGDWYSRGSWGVNVASRYTKRYKFSGGLNLQTSQIKLGEKGSPDYSANKSYSISWNHQKAPQTSPTTTFQANVNLSSSSHKRYNDRNVNDYLSSSASSSISFSKNWEGTPFSMTSSFNHSQNMRDSTYSFGFPNFSFSMSRIYPFKNNNRIGKKKFYEDIGVSFNTNFTNNISNVKEEDLFKDRFWEAMQNGLSNSFSIGLPTFTLAKYITASPNISYGQNVYFKSIKKTWDSTNGVVVVDTTAAFGAFGLSHTYSTGLSFSTRIFGLFDKFGKNSKLKAIRHVMTPSITISYTPNQKIAANGWRKVQINASGEMEYYNIYNVQGNSGRPSGSKPSGNISFSLGNTLEMKVRSDKDTTEGGEKKIKLLESLNISASYNIMADSMKLSNINFSGRTNLFDKVGINFGWRVNPYVINSQGRAINKYYWQQKFGLGEINSANFSTDYTFSGGRGKGTGGGTKAVGSANEMGDDGIGQNMAQGGLQDRETENLYTPYYVDFNVPWSLSVGFSYSYNKSYNYNNTTQLLRTIKTHSPTLDLRGDISLTENWKISASSGYDFKAKQITTSQFSLHRDLHCFEFSFSWVPFGFRKSWSFTIRAKSSMIRDALKYDKRSSFYDNYY